MIERERERGLVRVILDLNFQHSQTPHRNCATSPPHSLLHTTMSCISMDFLAKSSAEFEADSTKRLARNVTTLFIDKDVMLSRPAVQATSHIFSNKIDGTCCKSCPSHFMFLCV